MVLGEIISKTTRKKFVLRPEWRGERKFNKLDVDRIDANGKHDKYFKKNKSHWCTKVAPHKFKIDIEYQGKKIFEAIAIEQMRAFKMQ